MSLFAPTFNSILARTSAIVFPTRFSEAISELISAIVCFSNMGTMGANTALFNNKITKKNVIL
jgi:hypothetical protein